MIVYFNKTEGLRLSSCKDVLLLKRARTKRTSRNLPSPPVPARARFSTVHTASRRTKYDVFGQNLKNGTFSVVIHILRTDILSNNVCVV